MPSQFTAQESFTLSEALCKNLGIRLRHFPIKFLHSTIRHGFNEHIGIPLEGTTDENVQSRLRGMILYTRSNQSGAMALNTSNKSELAVGYSTTYGDTVGAISVIGDLFKTEVYTLSNYINKMFKNIIPNEIIQRPPTAELRKNQLDSDSLPPYPRLDAILEGLLSYRMTPQELIDLGHDQEEVRKVYRLYSISEYKRYQFCPILKVKAKSFGFGHRVPISKNFQYLLT